MIIHYVLYVKKKKKKVEFIHPTIFCTTYPTKELLVLIAGPSAHKAGDTLEGVPTHCRAQSHMYYYRQFGNSGQPTTCL